MPGKKIEKATCELCCDTLEKGQDTMKCEGECGCVVHRYCAGVTKRHFESLNKGHNPFVCQWCSMKVSRAIIEKLQSEVASLQYELAATKETLAKQSERLARASPPAASYASVASEPPENSQERRRQRRGQRQGPSRRAATNNPQQVQRTSSQASTTVAETSTTGSRSSTATTIVSTPQVRVRVEGARRIWGTHPHATTKTVDNAIGRFCNVRGLRIKRKTSKNLQTRKLSWWFVIHAEESMLQELDNKWDSLSTQISWILKPCSKPQDMEGTALISSKTSPNVQLPDGNPQQTSPTSTGQSPASVANNLSQKQSAPQKQPSQEVHPGTGDE